MYLRNLDFNLENGTVQGRLSDPLRLPCNPKTWVKSGSISFEESIVNRGILFKKLDWKISVFLLLVRRTRGLIQLFFSLNDASGMGLRTVSFRNLGINPVFSLYRFSKRSNRVSYFRRCFSSASFSLKAKYDKKSRKFKNIFPLIWSVENLQQAWFEIKSKQGNMTPDGDDKGEISDRLELDWFYKISKKLNSGEYKYKPARRILIDKPGKKNKRSLTISSPRDKLVQRAILRIMQPIYEGVSYWEQVDFDTFKEFHEPNRLSHGVNFKQIRLEKGFKIYEVRRWILNPIFHENSYGFRPNRSPHSALEIIKKKWAPVVWFWSADLVSAFDKVNQNRLISEIENTIDDPMIINELRKMFNVKIVNIKHINSESMLGTPQGSVLSSFLLNIYLTPLDYFISELKTKHDKTGSSFLNPEFRSLTRIYHKKFKDLSFRERIKRSKLERDKAKAAGVERTVTISKPIKINYVRYADDMLFGLNMDKPLAKKIIQTIRTFIKSNLHLDCHVGSKKSKLSHGISELITFLGFKIGLYPSNYSSKSKHLTRFYKLKANIQRKKIMESEEYFKMQENIFAKLHRSVVNSIALTGQSLVKKSQIKDAFDHRVKVKVLLSLKNSLSNIESEILSSSLVSNFSKNYIKNPETPLSLAEQKRLNLLKTTATKWIQRAQALANEEDFKELQLATGNFLSPEFVKAREVYLKELNLISSRDFSKKVIENLLRKAKSPQAKTATLNSVKPNHRSIRILFPKDAFLKKLRSLGIIHKVITRPTGVGFLTPLKDHNIISWYSLKANGIWNYYSCADNIWDLKKVLNWILRYSLLGTLAMKHKSSIKRMIQEYSLAPCINYSYTNKEGKEVESVLAQYPTQEYYNKKGIEFNNSSLAPMELEKLLKIKVNTLNAISTLNFKCAVKNCENDAEKIHHIRKRGHRLRSGVISSSGSRVIQGWKGIESALNGKQVPLCRSCHDKIDSGELSVNDLESLFIFTIKNDI